MAYSRTNPFQVGETLKFPSCKPETGNRPFSLPKLWKTQGIDCASHPFPPHPFSFCICRSTPSFPCCVMNRNPDVPCGRWWKGLTAATGRESGWDGSAAAFSSTVSGDLEICVSFSATLVCDLQGNNWGWLGGGQHI